MQCFHATVNQVRTRFPKETEVTNWETVSRVVFILFLDLLYANQHLEEES